MNHFTHATNLRNQLNFRIVECKFAAVSSGNSTQGWMLDGDDIQIRADGRLATMFGYKVTANVFERGVKGFGLEVDGQIIEVFTTREAAEQAALLGSNTQ